MMSGLVRVIAHWSVTIDADEDCQRHYHYVFARDGKEVAGFKRPEANISTSDKDYAGHTKDCNTGSIGVACAAMWAPEVSRDKKAIIKASEKNAVVRAWAATLTEAERQGAWKHTVDSPGPYPIVAVQFNAMCMRIAKLCKRYGIPVTPKTVLSHAEVEDTLGIKQRGKWDIAVLPFVGLKTKEACGDYMRKLVSEKLAAL